MKVTIRPAFKLESEIDLQNVWMMKDENFETKEKFGFSRENMTYSQKLASMKENSSFAHLLLVEKASLPRAQFKLKIKSFGSFVLLLSFINAILKYQTLIKIVSSLDSDVFNFSHFLELCAAIVKESRW
ncbi:hypothetical protein AVEN_172508-1 [Araneus ventricosus]|uniref:Uncharacterized protein n=1 Tax=Araneus ventricosus TaxID=182803 RepID=A0A4Y2DQD2_ARAVE|nr:hypothetical protein AVEN_172508-1 [Araneus ventricosus]